MAAIFFRCCAPPCVSLTPSSSSASRGTSNCPCTPPGFCVTSRRPLLPPPEGSLLPDATRSISLLGRANCQKKRSSCCGIGISGNRGGTVRCCSELRTPLISPTSTTIPAVPAVTPAGSSAGNSDGSSCCNTDAEKRAVSADITRTESVYNESSSVGSREAAGSYVAANGEVCQNGVSDAVGAMQQFEFTSGLRGPDAKFAGDRQVKTVGGANKTAGNAKRASGERRKVAGRRKKAESSAPHSEPASRSSQLLRAMMRGRFDEAASLATAPSAEHGVLDGKESAPVFIRAAATATAAAIGLSIVTAAPCLPTVSPASAAAFNRVADVAAAGLPAEVLPPIAAVNTGDVWPSLYHSAQFFSSFRPLPVPITFDEGSFADRSGFAAPPLVYTYPSTDASVETRNEPLTARAVAESSAVPASLPVSLPASLPAALPASLPAGNFALPAPSAAVLRVPPSGAAVTSAPVALEFPAAPAASADAGKEAAGSAGADAGAGADVVLGVNVSVLKAAFGTVFKLFGICAFVVCLQKSGILPKSTPSVLSQVSFRVLIPCFLMTKVAATLSGESLSALAVLPLIAILQVLVGTVLGKAACLVAFHKPSSLLPSAALLPSLVTGNTSSSSSSSSGSNTGSSKNNLKHSDGTSRETHTEPVSTAAEPASTAAAVSTALASAEAAAAALRTKESVVTAVCAFSNSLSLPLVFLTALLSQVDGDRAAGYLALFMMGWQPALWTIGYSILKDAGKPAGGASSSSTKATATSGAGHAAAAGGGVGGVRAWASNAVECVSGVAKKVFNPPMYGVLVGVVIGTTPLGHFFLPAAADAAAAATAAAAGSGDLLSSLFGPATAGVLHPLFGAAGMLGGACVPVQTIVLSSSLADALPANLSWPKFLPALPNLPTPPNPFANLQKSLSAKFPAPVFPAGSPPLADLHHLLQSLLTPSSSSSSSSHPASSPSYSSSSSSDSASSLWLLARLVPHQPFLGNSVLAASYSTAAAAAATASAASASVIAGGASAAVLAIPVQGIVERGAEGLERGAEGLERGEDGLERGEDGLKQVRSCEAESNTEAVGGVAMMGGGDATGALEVNGLDALELEMDLSMGQGAAMQLERPNTDAATGTAATASEAAAVGDAGAEGFPAAAAAVGEDVAAPIRSVAPTTPVATPVTMSPELAAALAPATAAALAPSSSAVFAHAAATPTASPQSIASATSPAAAVPASSALPAAVPAGGGGAAAAAAAPATAPALAGPQADLLDNRALVVVSLVRLLVSPIVGMTSIMALYHAHLIPQDPICVLCLMVPTAMPSSQSLVVLTQLSSKTRPLAGVLASLMLRQYALAMLPITIWVTVFLTILNIPM